VTAVGWKAMVQFPVGANGVLYFTAAKLTLPPPSSQPRIQWAPGRVARMTTHLHVVSRSRVVESILHFPYPFTVIV
jgi:hypothetical protein